MTIARFAVVAVAVALLTTPALADVKAGVDAWSQGDYRRAVSEWQGPADAGDADAQFNLGQAYKLGRGVPVDLRLAEKWYRLAALQDHPQAQDNYGLALFQNGKHAEAIEWLQKSARRGEPRAQFVLGTMYFNGDAVAKDYVRAYALLTRASSSGLPQANSTLTQIDRYITLDDRREGLELSRRYAEEEARGGAPVEVAATQRQPRRSRPVKTAELPPSDAGGIADQPYDPDVALTGSERLGDVASDPPARTPPVDRPVAQPVQVARADPPAPAPRQPQPMRAEPEIVPARPAPAPSGDWKIQLGAFGEPGNATKLWRQVGGRFAGREPSYVKSGRLTLVLVGPYASERDARSACAGVSPCIPTRR